MKCEWPILALLKLFILFSMRYLVVWVCPFGYFFWRYSTCYWLKKGFTSITVFLWQHIFFSLNFIYQIFRWHFIYVVCGYWMKPLHSLSLIFYSMGFLHEMGIKFIWFYDVEMNSWISCTIRFSGISRGVRLRRWESRSLLKWIYYLTKMPIKQPRTSHRFPTYRCWWMREVGRFWLRGHQLWWNLFCWCFLMHLYKSLFKLIFVQINFFFLLRCSF